MAISEQNLSESIKVHKKKYSLKIVIASLLFGLAIIEIKKIKSNTIK